MRSEFPLPIVRTRFGRIPEPTMQLPLKLTDGYLNVSFFLDTGADISMLPRSAAVYCGVDLQEAPTATATGITGEGIRAWVGNITVRIGHEDVPLPCLFTVNEDTPPLLGRAGLLDRFSILLDSPNHRIVFESVGR